ncbi:agmatinase, partial [candidate division KSB1 bacterium]|nr:agmatinase [candidate division KSB1 bacterium]
MNILFSESTAMQSHASPFLNPDPEFCNFADAAVVVLPFPYEGNISYGGGTAGGPDAILEASAQVEFYDAELGAEPMRMGIFTPEAPSIPPDPQGMIDCLYTTTHDLLQHDKFIAVLGGDHSISSGFARALKEKYGVLSVVQFDAHADLRQTYDDNPLSHASVLARIRDLTPHTLHLGIRSLCREEAEQAKEEQIPLFTMRDLRRRPEHAIAALQTLPDPVFVTFDVDALDTGIIHNTGTPEPGGLTWDETLDWLERVFMSKRVVGFDVVELSQRPGDLNSPFAAAKLVYK